MKFIKLIICALLLSNLYANDSFIMKPKFYDYFAISIDGDTISMLQYKNTKILIVNVASKCGYTSQYVELQQLYEKHRNELVILGFPSNLCKYQVSCSQYMYLSVGQHGIFVGFYFGALRLLRCGPWYKKEVLQNS